jgi:transcriptional regulator with XRE-family HTH domain
MKDRALAEKVGAAMRNRRLSLEVSQEAFADTIGMHRTYYSALERGEINLTLRTLRRVCSGLGIQVWELLKDAGV